ncbi:MAG: hypothetical protein AAGJ18_10760 [Bacteroidota bacterium]
MEIQFRFYRTTIDQQELPSSFFDIRGGLDKVMIGLDWSEVGTKERLLHQLEKVLGANLSFLDYWHEEVHEQYLEIDIFLKSLKELVTILMDNQDYHQQIDYPYLPNDFLSQGLLEAIQALINYFDIYRKQGATVFKMET